MLMLVMFAVDQQRADDCRGLVSGPGSTSAGRRFLRWRRRQPRGKAAVTLPTTYT